MRRNMPAGALAVLLTILTACGQALPETPTPVSTAAPSSTPEPFGVEELMKVYEDVPKEILFDVTLPRLTADTDGAAAINAQIEEDYAVDLTAGLTGDYSGLGVFNVYGNLNYHIWYEIYSFD